MIGAISNTPAFKAQIKILEVRNGEEYNQGLRITSAEQDKALVPFLDYIADSWAYDSRFHNETLALSKMFIEHLSLKQTSRPLPELSIKPSKKPCSSSGSCNWEVIDETPNRNKFIISTCPEHGTGKVPRKKDNGVIIEITDFKTAEAK